MRPFVNEYWTGRESWPFDTPDWVVFGRAVDKIGPLIAPDWDGDELGALPGQELPPWTLKKPDRLFISRALMVLFTLDATDPHAKALSADLTITKAPPPPPSLASPVRWVPPPAEVAAFPYMQLPPVRDAYERARELNRSREATLAAWATRATAVKRRITQACLFGELVTGYRLDTDGGIRTISANWWNTQNTEDRFRFGKIDRLNPLIPPQSYTSPTNFAFLYVSRASLAAFADSFGEPAPTSRPEWWPGPEARKTPWFGDETGANENAARARLHSKGHPGPSRAAVCRELADMWNEARPDDQTSWKSVQTMRAGFGK